MDTIICHRTFRQSSSSLSVYRTRPSPPFSQLPSSTRSLTPSLLPLSHLPHLFPLSSLPSCLPPPPVSLFTMGRTYITWGTPRWLPPPCSSSTSTLSPQRHTLPRVPQSGLWTTSPSSPVIICKHKGNNDRISSPDASVFAFHLLR